MKSITCKKQNRQVGHTSSHDGQGPIKEESHKWKLHEIINEGSESVYNYTNSLKAMLATYQLNGKETIWWQETKLDNKIRGKDMTWKLLRNTSKQKSS